MKGRRRFPISRGCLFPQSYFVLLDFTCQGGISKQRLLNHSCVASNADEWWVLKETKNQDSRLATSREQMKPPIVTWKEYNTCLTYSWAVEFGRVHDYHIMASGVLSNGCWPRQSCTQHHANGSICAACTVAFLDIWCLLGGWLRCVDISL